jgi:hypothetical protein
MEYIEQRNAEHGKNNIKWLAFSLISNGDLRKGNVDRLCLGEFSQEMRLLDVHTPPHPHTHTHICAHQVHTSLYIVYLSHGLFL